MTWNEVRLQVDVPSGWTRLEHVQPLTFESATGAQLRLTPFPVPRPLLETAGAEPLMSWALDEARKRLGAVHSAHVTPCRFGLLASMGSRAGARVRFWFLASDTHVMLVSLQGAPDAAEMRGAENIVESMHLVQAAQYPN